MAILTVEGIPPGLLDRLANTAAANGRCFNSEVILSLARHVCDDHHRKCPAGTDGVECPFGTWLPSQARRWRHIPWGDPG